MDLNSPVGALTVAQLMDIMKMSGSEGGEQSVKSSPEVTTEKKFVYGLKGLAELLHCSLSTASRIKKSGRIDKAVTQYGRKIIVDVGMALELLKHPQKGRR